MLWRLYIGRGLRWYGPLHTFTLWPYWRKAERSNL
jgi:hypothetical protein